MKNISQKYFLEVAQKDFDQTVKEISKKKR